jgi:hypothetical protein
MHGDRVSAPAGAVAAPVGLLERLIARLLGPRQGRGYRLLAIGLTAAGVVLTVALWRHGRSYYTLPVADRIDHPEHARLRASGAVGHFYGIAGTVLILMNLLYLLRKQAKFLRGRGSLRAWMEMHVFAGLIGSALIVFHSAFQVRNQVASAASWSLAILVATGLLGRYMYAFLPRSLTGDEEAVEDVQARIGSRRKELALRIGEGETAREVFRLLGGRVASLSGSPLTALFRLPLLALDRLRDRAARKAIREALRRGGPADEAERRETEAMAAGILRDEGRKRAATVYKDLFLWWRALHRAFALVMVAAMLVHVGVALYYGYRWIL